MTKPKSKREQVQDELVEFINRQSYDAPYGVLEGVKDLPKGGKARTITFGIAATLDAELVIWTPERFTLRTQGPMSRYFRSEYNSLEDLKRDLYEAVN